MNRLSRAAVLFFCLSGPFGMAVAGIPLSHQVLTTLQATYSIASALVQGTSIQVANVPQQGTPMDSQAFALTRADEATLRNAEAVIGIGRLWHDDPLYPAVRARNLRTVNIDATFPWSGAEPGVAVIRKPVSDVPWAGASAEIDPGLSRYVWLSPTNAARMAELVAADLARLSPGDAARIATNLTAFTRTMREFKAEYGGRTATVADPRVLSLADEFVYLYSDLGVFVDGWFVKQDVNWTDADCAALTAYLKEHDVRVVVHKWEPDAKIAAAIAAGGAKLVLLDAGDPGVAAQKGALPTDGYQTLMRANAEALLAAFTAGKP